MLTGQVLQSYTRDFDGEHFSDPAFNVSLSRQNRYFQNFFNYTDRSPDFHTELGFVPRVDIRDLSNFAAYRWHPKKSRVQAFGPNLYTEAIWDHNGKLQDWRVNMPFEIDFTGNTFIFVRRAEFAESFAGILQPIASTTGWLFVTQGRTFDMFRWGLIGSTLTVASIIVGLPWGVVGVAAAYSLTNLVVVIPLLFWFVGRSGPVRARDIYRTIGLSIAMVPIVIVTLFLLRRSLGDVDSLLGLAVALGATGCVAVIVLYISASGRAAVRDIVSSVATLGTARSTPR